MAAAADAFATFGFDATTMEGIAAQARTSIGSLYQFFPNKHALFREVAQACLVKSRALLERTLSAHASTTDWRVLVDAVIDAYRELQRDRCLQAIYRNLQLYSEWAGKDEAMQDEAVHMSAGLLAMWAPRIDADHRSTIGRTVVNAITALMLHLSRVHDEREADALVAETKEMLRRYLAPYIPG